MLCYRLGILGFCSIERMECDLRSGKVAFCSELQTGGVIDIHRSQTSTDAEEETRFEMSSKSSKTSIERLEKALFVR